VKYDLKIHCDNRSHWRCNQVLQPIVRWPDLCQENQKAISSALHFGQKLNELLWAVSTFLGWNATSKVCLFSRMRSTWGNRPTRLGPAQVRHTVQWISLKTHSQTNRYCIFKTLLSRVSSINSQLEHACEVSHASIFSFNQSRHHRIVR